MTDDLNDKLENELINFEALIQQIKLSAEVKRSHSESVNIAPQSLLNEFSGSNGLGLGDVERGVLSYGFIPERYSRNLNTFSVSGQEKICAAKIALVGLGGLGGHVLELLARAGVGSIKACDGDVFEPSNLNRQLLSTEANIGLKKSTAASDRVRLINSAVAFEEVDEFLRGEDFMDFFKDADIAVDCLGGTEFRSDLKIAAAKAGIHLVSAGVAGWTGMVATILPGGISPFDFLGGSEGLEEELGTQGPGIVMAAGLQCSEVLKIASGMNPGLAGKALLFDLMKMYFDTVTF